MSSGPCSFCGAPCDESRCFEITDDMVQRGADAYEFGVMPGDESRATEDELRVMARRVLEAALAGRDRA